MHRHQQQHTLRLYAHELARPTEEQLAQLGDFELASGDAVPWPPRIAHADLCARRHFDTSYGHDRVLGAYYHRCGGLGAGGCGAITITAGMQLNRAVRRGRRRQLLVVRGWRRCGARRCYSS